VQSPKRQRKDSEADSSSDEADGTDGDDHSKDID
jgi:hypothetical protein